MNKRILGGLAAAAMLAGGLAFSSAGTVSAATGNGQTVCTELDSGKIDTSGVAMTVTITAPTGNLITGYCVKAGSDESVPDGAVVYVTVDPAQASVTFPHPSGKSISHYSYSYEPIPPVNVTPVFVYTPPTCVAAGTAVPVEATGISWAKDGDVWNASATLGHILSAESKSQFGPYALALLTGAGCPATPPPPETPAVPPVVVDAPAPAVAVAALPPTQVSASGATTQAPVIPAAGLPATGIDGTGVTAIIALLLTSLGGAALFLSRRRNATI